MTIETWLAFVATSCVVLALPGPTALVILRYASERGDGVLVRAVAGAVLGDAIALTICNFGLGTLLATSAGLLTVIKVAAAAYLIGLGIATLSQSPGLASTPRPRASRPFLGVFLVTAMNPKSIAFFCALLPQFVDGGAPVAPQLALLQATFCALSLIATAIWALVGFSLRRAAADGAVGRLVRRGSGLILIGAGVSQLTGRLA